MKTRTKYLTIGFIAVLLVAASVAIIFEAQPAEAMSLETFCFTYALGNCDGIDNLDCVRASYGNCMNPIILRDTITVTAD